MNDVGETGRVHRLRERLELYKFAGRFCQDREPWNVAFHHGNFIAAMQARTDVAVLVDLVRQVFAARFGESEMREEFRLARKKADAGNLMFLRFLQQSLD